ncbi:MAG: DsrE family protein [Longimicrobiales bacterium]|nr:DsrE family protein [Longimicrobiales bacterium]
MPIRHPVLTILLALLAFAAGPAGSLAQQAPRAGPIIASGGAVFDVDPDVATPVDREYKLAFEVASPAATPGTLNAGFNTVARFLNMHAQAGVPADHLHAGIVVHGAASFELLDDEAHRARFGVDNPNGELLRELVDAGHRVILCGQSAASRGVPTDDLVAGVEVALSAMTAFLLLQDEGYRVNPW